MARVRAWSEISVADVRVEHEVKFADFIKWLDRPPRSPRDVSARYENGSILGMPVSRSATEPDQRTLNKAPGKTGGYGLLKN